MRPNWNDAVIDQPERTSSTDRPRRKPGIASRGSGLLLPALLSTVGPFFLQASNARACTCSPEAGAPACHLFTLSSVVLLGATMENVSYSPGDGVSERSYYRFQVDRVYKGLDPATSEVLIESGESHPCSGIFPPGETYLVFATVRTEDPLVLYASGCASRRAAQHPEDIEFLERYLRGETETVVYGKVLEWVTWIGRPVEKKIAPIGGARVLLAGDRFERWAETGPDGSYRFEGIPSGDYRLSAERLPYLPDPPSYEASLSEGTCQEIFIQLKPQCRIEGTVRLPGGEPAVHQRIELRRRSLQGDWYYTFKMFTVTDEAGRFSFEEMESGEYLFGLELWRGFSKPDEFPVWYFPGTWDRSKAAVLALEPQESIEGLDLIIPAAAPWNVPATD